MYVVMMEANVLEQNEVGGPIPPITIMLNKQSL